MITNVRRVESSGDIQRYVRYTIAPEKDKKNKHYIHGERTLSIESDYIDVGLDVERNRTSHEVTDQLMQWNEEKRAGKKPPASPAMAGVISFSSSDTAKFMSTDKDGNEYLDHQKIIKVAREAVGETMGYDRPMYFALHGDKKHLHVHFVASMIDSQGKVYDRSYQLDDQGNKTKNAKGKYIKVRDYRLWEITNEHLEAKYDLEKVEHRVAFKSQGDHRRTDSIRPTNAAVHLAERGELAPSLDLAARLELSYNECNKQFDKFLELTKQHGIQIKPNMNSSNVNGLSFFIDGMTIDKEGNKHYLSGSKMGNKYKWAKLSKELNYEHERDYPKLAELKATAGANASTIGTSERVASITHNINKSAEGTNYQIEGSRSEQSNEPSQRTDLNTNKSKRINPTSDNTREVIKEHKPSGFGNEYYEENANSKPDSNIPSYLSDGPSFSSSSKTIEEERTTRTSTTSSTDSTLNAFTDDAAQVNNQAFLLFRERTLRGFVSKGFTREQSVEMFDQEQARHRKLVVQSEKPHAETWTPDKGLDKRLAAASSKNEPDDSMDDPAGRLKQASKNAGYDYESETGKFLKQKGYNSETGKPEKGKGGSGSGNDDCNCQ